MTVSPCFVVPCVEGQSLAEINPGEVERERAYILFSRCAIMFHIIFKIYFPWGVNKGIFRCVYTEGFFFYQEHWLKSECEPLFWVRFAEVISHGNSGGNYENTLNIQFLVYVFFIKSHDIIWNKHWLFLRLLAFHMWQIL